MDRPISIPQAAPSQDAPSRARAFVRALPGLLALTGQRLLFALLVLPAIAFLTLFGLDMARGSTGSAALARALEETPRYLARLLQGELGLTAAGSITQRPLPVTDILGQVLLRSLGLLGAALVIAALVAVPLGIWAAGVRDSKRSLGLLLVSITGVSLPSFALALLLQFLLLRWAQETGSHLLPLGGFGWDTHIFLPALVLAARPIAQIFRITYGAVAEALAQDFVRTARSKGLHPARILFGHVLRNGAIPVLTTLGLSFRFSLSSLPVVEFFFGWPGVGFILLKAIARRDDNLTLALVLCLGGLFILVNLLLDLSYRLVDPRLRQNQGEARPPGPRLWDALRALPGELVDGLGGLFRRLRPAPQEPDPFRELLARRGQAVTGPDRETRGERRRAWLRGTLGNLPFVLGSLLVLILALVFFLGPRLAPHSPYTTQGLEFVDGEFRAPPFPPDAVHPLGTDALGRDILSLILAGAQQTLLLALMVVAARLALGLLLGALAGWFPGSGLDRAILGLAETVAAFPTLLLAMILILALGIRQGLPPFLIALSLVGWGEIMQFVRAQVMTLRPRPFIESAVAVGLGTPGIVRRHVLPNLLPTLISIAALEMGGVLMLLGELGFIGIFIGGGAFAELDIGAAPYHYSDVPEWGALLSNVRTYARTYPWMALYPALAFFTAILGFNLFGEGLRRMVETVGLGVRWLFNRYTLVAAAVLFLGWGWVQENTGAIAFYRQQAALFDGSRALEAAATLTRPELQGRGLGTSGLTQAEEWVAQEFAALGLQPAGAEHSFFQPHKRSFQQLTAIPHLAFDNGLAPVYHQDFAEHPGPFRNLGAVAGPVQVFMAGELSTARTFGRVTYPAMKGQDFSGQILLLPSEESLGYLRGTPRGGVLVVADDPAALQRRVTLSSQDPTEPLFGTGRASDQDAPVLWISRELADRLLAPLGQSVERLRRFQAELNQDAIATLDLGVTGEMAVAGEIREGVAVRHVAGYLPGAAGAIPGGGEALDSQMVLVLAQLDQPPPNPDGVLAPGAGEAGGVAVMLEALRALQESGYQPYRTLLFVAFSGEGLEGGQFQGEPEAAQFLKGKYGFADAFDVVGVIRLRGLGVGDGKRLMLAAGGNQRLAQLFQRAARHMDTSTGRAKEPVDISVVFDEGSPFDSGQETPAIRLFWEGWPSLARTPQDSPERLSAQKLQQAGRTLAEALMVLGREREY